MRNRSPSAPQDAATANSPALLLRAMLKSILLWLLVTLAFAVAALASPVASAWLRAPNASARLLLAFGVAMTACTGLAIFLPRVAPPFVSSSSVFAPISVVMAALLFIPVSVPTTCSASTPATPVHTCTIQRSPLVNSVLWLAAAISPPATRHPRSGAGASGP